MSTVADPTADRLAQLRRDELTRFHALTHGPLWGPDDTPRTILLTADEHPLSLAGGRLRSTHAGDAPAVVVAVLEATEQDRPAEWDRHVEHLSTRALATSVTIASLCLSTAEDATSAYDARTLAADLARVGEGCRFTPAAVAVIGAAAARLGLLDLPAAQSILAELARVQAQPVPVFGSPSLRVLRLARQVVRTHETPDQWLHLVGRLWDAVDAAGLWWGQQIAAAAVYGRLGLGDGKGCAADAVGTLTTYGRSYPVELGTGMVGGRPVLTIRES